MTRRRLSRPPVLIVVLYLGLSLGYGLVNPLFEAPDAHWHYFTAQYIADNWRLPLLPPADSEELGGGDPAYDEFLSQEAAQPPLYYLLSALVIAPIDTGDARQQLWPNPRVMLGSADAPMNINAFVHGPWEAFPWQGYALAAHLLRIVSALFGAGTVLLIYGSARLVWPGAPDRAALAAALIAFLPQFGFHHGAITNDVLIIFLSSAALYQLLAIWQHGGSFRRFLLLGITIGLAILTKTAGLALLAYALLFVLVYEIRKRDNLPSTRLKDWLAVISPLLTVLLPALLVGGWLLVRNQMLYGDFTAANQFVRVAGGDRDYSLWQVLDESWRAWPSLIAVFGWFNVRGPLWIYLIWGALALLALGGALRSLLLRRVTKWTLPLLLAIYPLLIYLGIASFMLRTPAAQGRLLFPALVPLALGFAWGLSQWRWPSLPLLAGGAALATSLFCLAFVIPAAYAVPEPVAAVPASANRLDVDMGNGLFLLAIEANTPSVSPGEVAWITLYWQQRSPPQPIPPERLQNTGNDGRATETVVLLLGRNFEPVGKAQSYAGQGLYPPPLWPLGETIPDRVAVPLDESAQVPTGLTVNVATIGGERDVNATLLRAAPEEFPALSRTHAAQLGNAIQLVSASTVESVTLAGSDVEVAVRWQTTASVEQNWTTFVHVGDPASTPLAQGDSPPLGGDYPTSLWQANEVINDRYTIPLPPELPPGRYPVWIGMYDPDGFARLPLTVDGEQQPNDALQIGWVVVVSR